VARLAVRAVALIAGVLLLALGLWALVDPRSFYDQLAVWPPYNRHFLHDVGAFQTGLGATLLLGLVVADGLLLALSGVSVAAVLHAIAHIVDRDFGGRATDPAGLSVLALILVAAAFWRAADVRRTRT
jgi:hypothetical protein